MVKMIIARPKLPVKSVIWRSAHSIACTYLCHGPSNERSSQQRDFRGMAWRSVLAPGWLSHARRPCALRHGIKSTFAERITAHDTPGSHRATADDTVLLNC